jgi:hypothetical protein
MYSLHLLYIPNSHELIYSIQASLIIYTKQPRINLLQSSFLEPLEDKRNLIKMLNDKIEFIMKYFSQFKDVIVKLNYNVYCQL